MAREDIEDKLGSVDDATGQLSFEVSKLRWAEVVVEEYEVGSGGGDDSFDLLELTLSDERCGVGAGSMLNEGSCNFSSGATSEFLEFGQ